MHKAQNVIKNELKSAADKVKVGGTYAHYKNLGTTYKVLNLAITEADDSICVIYQAQYGDNLVFVRPLKSWLDEVEWEGQTVKRFTLQK